jgi:hypothetical protein
MAKHVPSFSAFRRRVDHPLLTATAKPLGRELYLRVRWPVALGRRSWLVCGCRGWVGGLAGPSAFGLWLGGWRTEDVQSRVGACVMEQHHHDPEIVLTLYRWVVGVDFAPVSSVLSTMHALAPRYACVLVEVHPAGRSSRCSIP